MTPEEMVARLLYRDGLMLVIDKPAGVAVHRGPKGGESLEDHFDALRFGLPRTPALAHRLDRDTSGCLVLGRHRKALAALGRMFKNGTVGKTYWAVVEGGPAEDEGRVELALSKRDETRGWWMKPDPEGQPAVTRWKVLGRWLEVTSPLAGEVDREAVGRGVQQQAPDSSYPPPQPSPARGEGARTARGETKLTWLALEPITGRTHQLRVHAAESGWPIVGDNIYGSAPRTGGKIQNLVARPDGKPVPTFPERAPILHLHSREIVVPISKNKPPVVTTAPAPEHMRKRLKACGWAGD
jgi:tRNA pseudouridine32 synthase/23S rRNA pseudouridine746 synthase